MQFVLSNIFGNVQYSHTLLDNSIYSKVDAVTQLPKHLTFVYGTLLVNGEVITIYVASKNLL